MKIGFIGLGIMGAGMAANLLKGGFDVRVWNRSAEKTTALLSQGAVPAATPAALAADSDVVILCVSDAAAVAQLLFAEQGVVSGAQPGLLVIDMSTISPRDSRAHAERLTAQGLRMLDAPVSGSREGAEQGTLSIMVGGDPATFEECRAIFSAMGTTLVHVGERCGDGQTVKLVNQLLASGHTLIMSEALLFAQAGGVDLEKTLAAVSAGAAGSWMLSNRGPQVIRRDWTPGFTIDLQLKSLSAVLSAAADHGVPVPTTAQLYQYYRALQAQGLGEEGHHALIKALEGLVGFRVGVAE
ncbi:NAD(P)-dependent oxidoreductase [Pelobacter seleniigenes]|uniref:NAD(P)-dependent oxidoreductase n=1 Tax=Pelobacter seleniigenes TaxID=407188 RepID=UPI0004A70152|nr:NAD(P)-dependent oxidoreductase [Pelobacter seleniigenes]